MNYLAINDPNRHRVAPNKLLVKNDPNDIFIIEMLALHLPSVCERIALRRRPVRRFAPGTFMAEV
jgi:hypothetical protein